MISQFLLEAIKQCEVGRTGLKPNREATVELLADIGPIDCLFPREWDRPSSRNFKRWIFHPRGCQSLSHCKIGGSPRCHGQRSEDSAATVGSHPFLMLQLGHKR